MLSYVVEANVGGKLAQIGSRLIDATARQMAENFFAKFAEVVVSSAAAAAPAAASAPTPVADAEAPPTTVAVTPPPSGGSVEAPPSRTPPSGAPTSESKRLSPAVWVTALAVVVIVLLYIFTR
jgi:hypothetical protein